MTTSTVHRIEPEQLRAPLRAFGLPVDEMDDDAISSAALHLYGVGASFGGTFAHLLSEDERSDARPGHRLRKLTEFCEAVEGMADAAAGAVAR